MTSPDNADLKYLVQLRIEAVAYSPPNLSVFAEGYMGRYINANALVYYSTLLTQYDDCTNSHIKGGISKHCHSFTHSVYIYCEMVKKLKMRISTCSTMPAHPWWGGGQLSNSESLFPALSFSSCKSLNVTSFFCFLVLVAIAAVPNGSIGSCSGGNWLLEGFVSCKFLTGGSSVHLLL